MRISDWSSDVCSCRSGQGVFLTLVLKLKHCSLLQAQRMGVFGSKGDMRRRTAFGDSRRLHAQLFCAKYVLPGDQVDTACPGLERLRSEEHPSELHSLMRIQTAVFSLKTKNTGGTHAA